MNNKQAKLAAVAERIRYVCALCGEPLSVGQVQDHARQHAKEGTCWNYDCFTWMSERCYWLEGYPVKDVQGRDCVWPFRLEAKEAGTAALTLAHAG